MLMGICIYISANNHLPILIIVQDMQHKAVFILQVYSTCFGCQPHPSSGIHKAVTKLAWPRWREVAAQKI